ncbi:crossover junction endodeoxyribonuclease RuvC [Candidatus Woesebacteria bacterium]|nr:crossover junction endodeoxyribonuclease RuvC [Candidatus Woesebacteria bacterium]
MNILAIDPGYDKLGFAVFDVQKKQLLCSGLIKTKRSTTTAQRLLTVYNGLCDVLRDHSISSIVVENLFFFKNQKTIVNVSKVIGVIELIAGQNAIEVALLTPLQIKQAITGYGQADKKSVQKMIELELKETFNHKEDDEVDAIACGYAFCLQQRFNKATR